MMMCRRRQNTIVLLLYGVGIGLINGFFGAGGGVLAVECMVRRGIVQNRAHASAILAILPLSAVSAGLYFLKGHLLFDASTWMLLGGGAVGGLLGAVLLGKLSAKWIDMLFTALILFSGIRMLMG